jgi:hypothetical protein
METEGFGNSTRLTVVFGTEQAVLIAVLQGKALEGTSPAHFGVDEACLEFVAVALVSA